MDQEREIVMASPEKRRTAMPLGSPAKRRGAGAGIVLPEDSEWLTDWRTARSRNKYVCSKYLRPRAYLQFCFDSLDVDGRLEGLRLDSSRAKVWHSKHLLFLS